MPHTNNNIRISGLTGLIDHDFDKWDLTEIEKAHKVSQTYPRSE